MKKNDNSYWQKLENTGMFYASIANTYSPDMYRLSVKLNEKVNSDMLKEALLDTLKAMPSFNVRLRKGLFWYYLDKNNADPIVDEDTHFTYTPINDHHNNNFLFKVTYYEKRINIDFSHVLADGKGSLSFLITLVTNYMKIKHPKKVNQSVISDPELISLPEMSVDSFSKYVDEPYDKEKIRKEHNKKAFLLVGPKVKMENANVIIGTLSVAKLKELTKKQGVTITTYLTAVLFYAIYHGNYKYTKSKAPITICIPVDLRQFFPSDSLNNFFATLAISLDAANKDHSFEEVLEIVDNKLKKELDKSVLINKFRFFTKLQNNIVLRFVPLVIKDFALKLARNYLTSKGPTTLFSNLGVVKVNEEIKEYIDKFDAIAYNYELMPIKVTVCSFDDKLSIAFATTLVNAEIERYFFTYLTNAGIDVKISTSLKDEDRGITK